MKGKENTEEVNQLPENDNFHTNENNNTTTEEEVKAEDTNPVAGSKERTVKKRTTNVKKPVVAELEIPETIQETDSSEVAQETEETEQETENKSKNNVFLTGTILFAVKPA